MAFTLANLQPIGGQTRKGQSPTIWAYATLDLHATVDSTGYFNDAANLLCAGDLIYVVVWETAIGSGTVSTYGLHIVKSNAGGVVDVSDVTAGTVTDTD